MMRYKRLYIHDVKPKLIGNQFGSPYRNAGIISDVAAFAPDVYLTPQSK
jgi:hypothetical protein